MDELPDYHLRRAEHDDAFALAALLRSIGGFRQIESQSEEQTHAQVARSLEHSLADESHSVYVAQDASGMLVGYVAAHWLPYLILAGPEGFVSELFIDPRVRGRGLGSGLLELVVIEAKGRGCSRLQLVNFRSRESYQRGFYSRLGWEERGDAADFVLSIDG